MTVEGGDDDDVLSLSGRRRLPSAINISMPNRLRRRKEKKHCWAAIDARVPYKKDNRAVISLTSPSTFPQTSFLMFCCQTLYFAL